MEEKTTPFLVPGEELLLYLRAVIEALEVARQGRQEAGREILWRGLAMALQWRRESWGPPLVRMWVRAIRRYDEVGW